MASDTKSEKLPVGPVDYEDLVRTFNRALIHTLRKHSVADNFLDFWVPDQDPVLGIAGMVDSARIAGVNDIEIRFLSSTIPPARLSEVKRALDGICSLSFDERDGAVYLRAKGMKADAAVISERHGAVPRPAYWQADVATGPGGADTASHWDTTELPELADVHPHFRVGLKAALSRIAYEGDMEVAGSDQLQVSGSEGQATLALLVDTNTGIVKRARHKGSAKPSERAILDLYCKAAEGFPVQEVADHAGLRVLDNLVDDDLSPPVGGVLLPVNAGAPFMLPGHLARQAYNAYRAKTGTTDSGNFYYAPPASDWQNLSADERVEKVTAVLRGFLQSEGLYPDDMALLRVERNKFGYDVRVIVGFSDRVSVAQKPDLMRRLERRLRRDLEPEIDLVADRARDTSPLRRLS
jgi:hypothetical protein